MENFDPENPHKAIEELTAQAAFDQAKKGWEFNGKALANFSPERKMTCQSMGMMYPIISDAAMAQYETTGAYPGMLKDITILLWVLSEVKQPSELSVSESRTSWTPQRAGNRPDEAFAAATVWADSVGLLEMTSETFQDGMIKFMAIVQGVSVSEFRIATEKTSEPDTEEPQKKT